MNNKLAETRQITPLCTSEVRTTVYEEINKIKLENYTLRDKKELLRELQSVAVNFYKPCIDLSGFQYMYPTSGITDGLNYLSLDIMPRDLRIAIPVAGDYEWISQFFQASTKPEKVTYVSNPSAADGNFLSDQKWQEILERPGITALDCAYLGTTELPQNQIKLTEKVTNLFVGASKTFGLPDLRIGLWFRVNPLIGSMGVLSRFGYWNPHNLQIYMSLMKKFKINDLHEAYKEKQKQVCEANGWYPSDVVFLATTQDKDYDFFKRGTTNRLCISTLF